MSYKIAYTLFYCNDLQIADYQLFKFYDQSLKKCNFLLLNHVYLYQISIDYYSRVKINFKSFTSKMCYKQLVFIELYSFLKSLTGHY